MIKAGGRPSFIGYGSKKNPFLFGLCTSVNDAVVHGVPSAQEILQDYLHRWVYLLYMVP